MSGGLPREWHGGTLPPGTPAPRSSPREATCSNCSVTSRVTLHEELGAADIVPEECPECGEPWAEDVELDYDEPDPDRERDMEVERGTPPRGPEWEDTEERTP